MLSITRNDDTLILLSDDENAENGFLEEAIDAAAPHLGERFEETKVGEDGLLRFSVGREDWESLADAIEELSCMAASVNPEELAAIEKAIRQALDSL